MKIVFLFFIVVLVTTKLYSQVFKIDTIHNTERPKSLTEVIQQINSDSAIFYYNERYQLVKPVCSIIFRIAGVDSSLGFFSGDFIDYYTDSIIAVEGNYTKGKKEGIFKFYFPNGQLEQIGKYVNNKKVGIWEYYYEDGSKHQIFEFKEKEIFVLELWNQKGKQLISSGNGKWFGFLTSEKYHRIRGKILNGKREGNWIREIPSMQLTMNEENYKDGVFRGGIFFSLNNGSKQYYDTSYCMLEQPAVFLTAETFQINQCYPNFNNRWEFANYPGGMEKFHKEIKEKMGLNNPLNFYGNIRLQTTIDKEGRLINFKPLSNTGYESELVKVLQAMRKWKPTKVDGKAVSQIKIINFYVK